MGKRTVYVAYAESEMRGKWKAHYIVAPDHDSAKAFAALNGWSVPEDAPAGRIEDIPRSRVPWVHDLTMDTTEAGHGGRRAG